MRSLIPHLITALKHLIKANQVSFYPRLVPDAGVSGVNPLHLRAQDQACEAMEVFNELMESEVSIIVPHVAEIVAFCLEVGAGLGLCFGVEPDFRRCNLPTTPFCSARWGATWH